MVVRRRSENFVLSRVEGFANEEERIAALRAIAADGYRPSEVAEFATRNYGLVMVFARQMHRKYPSVSVEDFCGEGYPGLVAAAEQFDVTRGVHFATYAAWIIRAYMQRAARNLYAPRVTKVPAYVEAVIMRFQRFRREYVMAHGDEPSDDVANAFLRLEFTRNDAMPRKRWAVAEYNIRTVLAAVYATPEELDAPARNGQGRRGDTFLAEGMSPEDVVMLAEMPVFARRVVAQVSEHVTMQVASGAVGWRDAWIYAHALRCDERSNGILAKMYDLSRAYIRVIVQNVAQNVCEAVQCDHAVVRAAFQCMEEE